MGKESVAAEVRCVPEWPEFKRREPKIQWVPASSGIFTTPEKYIWAFRRMNEKFGWGIRPNEFPPLPAKLLPEEFAAAGTIAEALERASEEANLPMPVWHLGYNAGRPEETIVMVTEALAKTFSVKTVDFSLDIARLRVAPGAEYQSGFFWQESDLALTRGWRFSPAETELWEWQPGMPLPQYSLWHPVEMQIDEEPAEETELRFGFEENAPIPAELFLDHGRRMAGLEILWLAVLVPSWIRSMDGKAAPFVFLPGLEVRPYGSDKWYGMPYLHWDKRREHLVIGYFTSVAHPYNSHWAVPHCYRRIYVG